MIDPRLCDASLDLLALASRYTAEVERQPGGMEAVAEMAVSFSVIDSVLENWPPGSTEETVLQLMMGFYGDGNIAEGWAVVFMEKPYTPGGGLGTSLKVDIKALTCEVLDRLGLPHQEAVKIPAVTGICIPDATRPVWENGYAAVLAHYPIQAAWLDQKRLAQALPAPQRSAGGPRL